MTDNLGHLSSELARLRKDIDAFGDFVVAAWDAFPTAKPLTESDALLIMTAGFGEEAGEVQGKVKKYIRDGHLDRRALLRELGDAAFYWARLCRQFGFQPSEALAALREKHAERTARGTLNGSGDDR